MTDATPAPAEALSHLEQATQAVNTMLGGKLWQHVKTGGVYLEHGRGTTFFDRAPGDKLSSGITSAPLTVTDEIVHGEEVVSYRNVVTGERWARPARLFDDGRFVPLTLAPADLLDRTKASEAERDRLREREAVLQRLAVNWESESITLHAQETNAQGVWLDEGSKSEYQTLQRCIEEIAQALASAEGASHE